MESKREEIVFNQFNFKRKKSQPKVSTPGPGNYNLNYKFTEQSPKGVKIGKSLKWVK